IVTDRRFGRTIGRLVEPAARRGAGSTHLLAPNRDRWSSATRSDLAGDHRLRSRSYPMLQEHAEVSFSRPICVYPEQSSRTLLRIGVSPVIAEAELAERTSRYQDSHTCCRREPRTRPRL